MKYQLNNYIEALTGVLEKTPKEKRDSLVSNFVKLLRKTGDIRSQNKIIEAVHKRLIKKDGGHWVGIETARELPEMKKKLMSGKFSAKDYLDFRINPELVAGVRVSLDGEEELDNSLSRKLKKLLA